MGLPQIPLLVISALMLPGAARTPHFSWGKPDVAFTDYRRDAVECGVVGATADVSDLKPTRQYARTVKSLDQELNARNGGVINYQQMIKLYRPNDRVEEVGDHLHTLVAECLTKRGYSRYALTPTQSKRLGRLAKGSEARHRYLHSLASNEQVLLDQQIEE